MHFSLYFRDKISPKMVKEAPDDKSEENIHLLKLNLIGGMFSAFLLSDASLIIFAADFIKISHINGEGGT